jgi:putative peptidoglycan binding protein
MRTQLSLGLFAIVAVLVAGVAYWATRENAHVAPPQSPSPSSQVAEAPAPPVQSPPVSANSPGAQPAQTSALPPSSPPPDSAASGLTTSANPSAQSAAPSSPSGPSAQSQSPSPAPSAALASALPAEEQMSAANRRQMQEALHRRGYYDGPVDGIFGPLTRAAIRRFQESIGEKGTGHLSATEANRLVGPS